MMFANATKFYRKSGEAEGSAVQPTFPWKCFSTEDSFLSAAALLGKTLRNVEHQNFGFATKGRYLVSINLSLGNDKPEHMEPLFREIDDRLRQIPGVCMVAPVLYAPTSGDSWNNGIRIAGRPEPPAQGRYERRLGTRDAGPLRNHRSEDARRISN
jgi:hypothetical protein